MSVLHVACFSEERACKTLTHLEIHDFVRAQEAAFHCPTGAH